MMFCQLQPGSRLSQDEETALYLVPEPSVASDPPAERRAGGKGAAGVAAAKRTLAAEHRSATAHLTTDGGALQMSPAAFVQFRTVDLDPPPNATGAVGLGRR